MKFDLQYSIIKYEVLAVRSIRVLSKLITDFGEYDCRYAFIKVKKSIQ